MSPPAATNPAYGSGVLARREVAYVTCAATFAVVLVLTNIIGVKLFYLFPGGRPAWLGGGDPITLTSGIITYPMTFLLTDLVSEIWGRRRADLMVVLGFVMSFLMLAFVQLALALPPSDFWTNPGLGVETSLQSQRAFQVTFALPQVLLFASMLAYLVAQLFDVRLYHFWWRITAGKHMWLRNNGSTMISQLVDTFIVNGIFLRFGLEMEWDAILAIILAVYLCKVVLALLDTPLIYLGRSLLFRWLQIDPEAPAGHPPLA